MALVCCYCFVYWYCFLKRLFIFEEHSFDMVGNHSPLERKIVFEYAKSIANAINFLHNIGIPNKNISPNNIYVNSVDIQKLSTFEFVTRTKTKVIQTVFVPLVEALQSKYFRKE